MPQRPPVPALAAQPSRWSRLQAEFRGLDTRDPSTWPLVPRLALCAAMAGLILLGLWMALIRGIAKLAKDWEGLPKASPPALSTIWRRLLAQTQLRIEANGSLHAMLGKKTILYAPSALRAEWAELFGEDLAASLAQFAGQARDAGQAVVVPADEL